MTAGQRREMVLQAAPIEFAARGLDGTSTRDIARRAGISHPYLFRLFPTKKALFVSLVGRCYQEVSQALATAAAGYAGEDALQAMGSAFGQLCQERTLPLMQLHAYAAWADPDIRAVTQAAFGDQRDSVEQLTGLPPARAQRWLGTAMLMTAAIAMNLQSHRKKPNYVTEETAMYPAISHELAKARAADLRQQARREGRARAARRARHTPPRLNVDDDAQCQALFASSLQRSDAPSADVVSEAIRVTVLQLGTDDCAGRMAQEFGDHPEAAAERMRWVRLLLSSCQSFPAPGYSGGGRQDIGRTSYSADRAGPGTVAGERPQQGSDTGLSRRAGPQPGPSNTATSPEFRKITSSSP